MNEFNDPPGSYVFAGKGNFVNRFLWEVLPDGAWRDKPCFIVGGEPSLQDFDWSLLKGKRTIAVNRAYEKFDPTVIFSMDTRFLRWILQDRYGEEAKRKFEISRAYKTWLCTYNCRLPDNIYIVKVHKSYQAGFRIFTDSMKDGIGHGNNSGYAALNIAYCLGANPIYLLGFDMRHEGRVTHWHGGHPEPQKKSKVNSFSQWFALPAIRAREKNIRIINLNPNSDLEFFPKKKCQEILH